jgi:hypothetical protein
LRFDPGAIATSILPRLCRRTMMDGFRAPASALAHKARFPDFKGLMIAPNRPAKSRPKVERVPQDDHRLSRPLHDRAAEAGAWRDRQLAGLADGNRTLPGPAPDISDDGCVRDHRGKQLKMQQDRGSDVTIFSPRAAGMAHHVGTQKTSEDWARVCNDLIYRVSELFPKNFIGVASCRSRPA